METLVFVEALFSEAAAGSSVLFYPPGGAKSRDIVFLIKGGSEEQSV